MSLYVDEKVRDPGAVGGPRGSRLYGWLNDRYNLDGLIAFLRKKEVPITSMSFTYYFGGIALMLFAVQVVSGILLLMYYVPSADAAYESVQYITSKVRFGWLVRSVHVWSANLMILSVFIHMFTVFFMRAYRKPRELTWVSGCCLLGLSMGFGFSGYLLPWNELAFFATKVGTDMVRSVPLVGDYLLQLLRGGEDVTGTTLGRFFGLHVAILPAITSSVIIAHLLAIQRQGMSQPTEWLDQPPEQRRSMPFFPHFFLRDLLLWLVIFNVVAAMSVFWPAALGLKADPFAPAPAGIKPEWYFLSTYQVLKWLPAEIGPITGELVGMLAMGAGALLALLLPFLDRTPEGGPRKLWLDIVGISVLLYLIIMTGIGHVSH